LKQSGHRSATGTDYIAYREFHGQEVCNAHYAASRQLAAITGLAAIGIAAAPHDAKALWLGISGLGSARCRGTSDLCAA
jgi:hypothetical protein